MSARLVRAVPAWYEVRGTTGSPSFTSSSSTVPAIGARMIDSTDEAAPLLTRPFSMRASRSVARLSRICASWMSFSAWSQSWVATMPWSLSVRERSYFFWAWSKTFFAISDLAAGLGQLHRRGVGQDLEQRVPGPDLVPDLAEGRLDDARRSCS